MRRQAVTARCGVYVIEGPAGMYVGVSVDCVRRNEQVTKLGLAWRIVRELPRDASLQVRCAAETAVADELIAAGHIVVSHNSTVAMCTAALRREAQYGTMRRHAANGRGGWPAGKKPSRAHRQKISLSKRGKSLTAEHKARIGESMRRTLATRRTTMQS